ncbi:1-aminocyclopropane-1-carboxylate deaminase/D-cysteine desulfhydrase [Christiangramia portivictoriae]|uniref:1-aminocyclopropane-1-carboxylate deaminase/D-cysteine desulfhydrase n=1 Tax=Christiangramia portivictoriae TaxID=326069 RepID=UPI0003F7A3B8|nr:pyridoxal-phosphate dependent enzyme [Christiangramia portivictoriae]
MNSIFHTSEVFVSQNQFVAEFSNSVILDIKREDLLHAEVSGNKFRKLKYSILQASELNRTSLLTFGGAHSNHIAATAAAGKLQGIPTIGFIRGEELEFQKDAWSPTLNYAASCGMKLKFLSREAYRQKGILSFLNEIRSQFPDAMIIPEGGTSELAIKGCEEILTEADRDYDYICTSVGTGGTMAGLVNASSAHQNILGFSALKSAHLSEEIKRMTHKKNWNINSDYHFGGYARTSSALIDFMNDFFRKTRIKLDPVYTGKLLFGIFELAQKNFFPKDSKILAIHTGGLQGIDGMNERLRKKAQPQIITEL